MTTRSRNRINYLSDCAVMRGLSDASLPTKTAQADSGAMTGLASGIKEYVSSLWRPDDPVDSILSFLAPGILAASGFGWIAFIYEVAEVLGFDMIGFFQSVRQSLTGFVTELVSGKQPLGQEDIHAAVSKAATDAAAQHFNGPTDVSKLTQLATSAPSFLTDLQEADDVRRFAAAMTPLSTILKTAGVLSIFKGKLARLIIRMVSWLMTSALISLGFAAAGGAVQAVVGIRPGQGPLGSAAPTTALPVFSPQAVSFMRANQARQMPAQLMEQHANSQQATWVENGSLDSLPVLITQWITQAYPSLAPHASSIRSSPAMQRVVGLFQARNRMSGGTGIIAIPRPFERPIDIVDQVVAGYIDANPTLDLV